MMAAHYRVGVLPARPRKPRDKTMGGFPASGSPTGFTVRHTENITDRKRHLSGVISSFTSRYSFLHIAPCPDDGAVIGTSRAGRAPRPPQPRKTPRKPRVARRHGAPCPKKAPQLLKQKVRSGKELCEIYGLAVDLKLG
jgi:hypothetical protein